MRIKPVIGVAVSSVLLALVNPTSLVYCEPDKPTVSEELASDTKRDVVTKSHRFSKYPVIISLETRRGTIVILSGPDRLLYSVADRSGLVVQRELSERELRARHPEIYDQIKGALASRSVWAGM